MGARKRAAVERVAGLRYRQSGDARVVVEAWRQSGGTLVGFARRYGIHPGWLRRWARDLERAAAAEEAGVGFHPVRLVQGGERRGAPGGGALEIVLESAW